MKILLLIIPFVLAGCATTEPQIKIQRVEVPVLTKCYDKPIPDSPKLLTDTLEEKAPLDIWLNGALTDVNKLKVYSEELRTFICK